MLLIKWQSIDIFVSYIHIPVQLRSVVVFEKNHVSCSKMNSRAVLSCRIACNVATSCSSRHVGTCLFEVTDFILLSVRSVLCHIHFILIRSFVRHTVLLFWVRSFHWDNTAPSRWCAWVGGVIQFKRIWFVEIPARGVCMCLVP